MTLKSESTAALSGDEEKDFSECSENVYLLDEKDKKQIKFDSECDSDSDN